MICPKCGSENLDASEFCSNCSTALQEMAVIKNPKKSVTEKWWFWVIVVFVLIAVLSTVPSNETVSKDFWGLAERVTRIMYMPY